MNTGALLGLLVLVSLSVILHLSWRLRFYMFLFFIFLSLGKLPIGIWFLSEQTLRLPMAMMLLMGGYREVFRAVNWSLNPMTLLLLLFWTIYISVYWVLSPLKVPQDLYESVGNLIFFVLVMAYVQRMSSRQLRTLIVFVVITRIPGLLINNLAFRSTLESMGFYWGTTYHQATGHAAVSLLPFLLLGVTTSRRRSVQLLFWAVIALTSYIIIDSGARTPALLFGLVLVFWWRKVKYGLVTGVLVLLAFQLYMTSMQSEPTQERYERLFSLVSTGDMAEAHNVEFRYEHLIYGLRAFLDEPILGNGYNSWLDIVGDRVGLIGYTTAPHNEPLRILVEYGLVGFVLFFLFVYYCISGLEKRPSKDFWRAVSYAIFLAVASHVVVNTFHNALFSRYFFFICALGSVFPSMMKRLEYESEHKGRVKRGAAP